MKIETLLFKEITIFSELFLGISIVYLVIHCTFLAIQKKYPLIQISVLYLSVLVLFFASYLILNEHLNVLEMACLNNTFINDYASFFSKFIIGSLSIFCLLMMQPYILSQKINNFEYFLLILFAVLGLFLLCSSNDFLTAYLAIELQSLSFYVLAAFKKNSTFSVDAGIKYFILGAFASSLFLFGSSILYGITGTLNFDDFHILFMNIFPESGLERDVLQGLGSFDNREESSFNDICSMFDFPIYESLYFNSSLDINGIIELYRILDFVESLEESILDDISMFNLPVSELLNVNSSLDINDIIELYKVLEENLEESILDDISMFNLPFSELLNVNSSLDVNDIIELYKVLEENLEENLFYGISMSNLPLTESINVNSPLDINGIIELYKGLELIENSAENVLHYIFMSNLPLTESVILNSFLNINNITELYGFLDSSVHLKLFEDANMFDISSDFNADLIKFALIFIFIGLFFKLTIAPFHTWAPDVYEGSPTSSTFFFSVVPKLAIFILLLRIFYYSFYGFVDSWRNFIVLVVVFSIIVGSFGGLEQRKLKSLLVYSTISHMGYSLIAFSAGTFESLQMLLSYLIVYSFSGLCVWSIFIATRVKTCYSQKQNKDLTDLVMLSKSNYMLAIFFTTVLFSIAGFPPMIGFLVKMGVFLTALESSMYFVALISILCSVVGTFYYIRLIKILYFEKVIVGKLYYPIDYQNSIIITVLFFMLLFLFVNPTLLFLLSHKFSLLVFY